MHVLSFFNQLTCWVVVFLVSFAPFCQYDLLAFYARVALDSSTIWDANAYSILKAWPQCQAGFATVKRAWFHLVSPTVFSIQSPQWLIGPFRWEHARSSCLADLSPFSYSCQRVNTCACIEQYFFRWILFIFFSDTNLIWRDASLASLCRIFIIR